MDHLSTPAPIGPNSSRERKQNDSINQNRVLKSPHLNVRKTPSGTVLTLDPRFRYAYAGINYLGDFNGDLGAQPKDCVTVTTGSLAGIWICQAPVPEKSFSDAFIAAGLNTSADFSASMLYRVPGINYGPQSPEPATTASVVNRSGSYWHKLSSASSGSYVTMSLCVTDYAGNRSIQTWFVDAYLSGST